MGLFDSLTKTLGVEPGSETLRVIEDGNLIFNEPARISFNKMDNRVTGIGTSANAEEASKIVYPVNCTIGDFQAFEMLLRGALKKSTKSGLLPASYKFYFAIPSNTTETEKRVYRDSAEHAGGTNIRLVHQNITAAAGMNILIEKKDFILIDFGKSKFEITAFADAMPVATGIIRYGTAKISRLIRNYLFRQHGLELSTDEIDKLFSTLNPHLEEVTILSKTIKLAAIKDYLTCYFHLVKDEALEVLELITHHPHFTKIIFNGIYLTGGGILNEFLYSQIRIETKMPVQKSNNPTTDSIRGLARIMKEQGTFAKYIMT